MGAMRKPRKPLTKIVDFEEMDVSLDALKVCPELLQIRARTDKKVSQHYSVCRAKGSVFPPVLVFRVGEDLYLADGFHRFDAWKQLGFSTIPAVIRDGTIEDALLAGLEANGNDLNMRKLNEEDRRHAVELMICAETFRVWPNKHIGLRCGLSAGAVRRIRVDLASRSIADIPDRVSQFTGGVPNGRTVPYRSNRGALRRISVNPNDNNRLTSHFDGKTVGLGTNLEVAKLSLEKLYRDRAEVNRSFGDNDRFKSFMSSRRIHIVGIHPRDCPIGGSRIGNVAIEPIAQDDTDNFLERFLSKSARLLYVRTVLPDITRLVMVGYTVGINNQVTRLRPHTASLGIEVMTPEEFVAEFGPEGDGGDTPESPDAGREGLR